ncbi:hypothetical protein GGH96_006164 [Coemansia sp. RSA 1972]|nr:hypothetical protein GGH96_006164 [Coemansia sp. RSA 1972]
MVLDSLFILNDAGAPIMQKHWGTDLSMQRATRVVIPAFSRYLTSQTDAAPIWSGPLSTTCMHIQRGSLTYTAVVSTEVAPLEILELLESISTLLYEYTGQVATELTIKENFVCVYQLLSEMVDSGRVVTTDTSVLRGLVPVPTLMGRVIENVSGFSTNTLASSTASHDAPWRARGIRHTSNEFFVDIVDRIDAIIDTNGTCVSYDILGDISCKSRLSGMPHLVMTLSRARELDDMAFHPCVVRRMWDAERTIAFVPPDGPFKLASYHLAPQTMRTMPLRILGEAKCTENGMTVHVVVQPGETGSRCVENIRIRVPLDSRAYNIGVQCKSGTHMVTTSRRPQVEWTLDSVRPSDSAIRLTIQYSLRNAEQSDSTSAAFVTFEVPGHSVSAIKVDALRLLRESYKLFKGVRYSTVAGSFQVRF